MQENAVEHVEIGSAPEAASVRHFCATPCANRLMEGIQASEVLETIDAAESEISKPIISKKEKQALKREAFLQSAS